MSGHRIRLGKGFRLDKHGKPARTDAHLDVSSKLRRRASRRVRVVTRRTAK
jgi:hypothetical protein